MNMQHAERAKIKSMQKTKGSRLFGRLKFKLVIKTFILLLLLVSAGFITKEIYHKLCHNDFFQITTMKIDGNRKVSKEQITALSKVDIHSNLLALDVPQVKSLLESHPWIDRAEITRNWPNQLLITVKEKKPVALLHRDTGLFYLDNKGHIIAAASSSQELDFAVVTGLEKFSYPTHTTKTPEILQDAMDLLKLASRNNSILPDVS